MIMNPSLHIHYIYLPSPVLLSLFIEPFLLLLYNRCIQKNPLFASALTILITYTHLDLLPVFIYSFSLLSVLVCTTWQNTQQQNHTACVRESGYCFFPSSSNTVQASFRHLPLYYLSL